MSTAIYAAKYAAKAIYAGVATFVASTAVVLVDDANLGDITDGQWFVIAGFTIAAVGGVFGLTNVPKR